jgi:hypothetical protein
MHPCLKIPEILGNIFQDTQADIPLTSTLSVSRQWPDVGASTLARAARTCKTLTEPALDILWRVQPSLIALIQCLPADALQKDSNLNMLVSHIRIACHLPLTAHLQQFRRELRPEDYMRIYYYSSRIIGLGGLVCEDGGYDLHPLVTSILWSRTPNFGPLFPKLRHLDVPLSEFYGQALYPRLVIGPRLQTVMIRTDYDGLEYDYPWDNLASVLKSSSPHITTFSVEALCGRNDMTKTPPEIMALYCGFQRMESLDAPSIVLTHDALSHLAILSRLKSLRISIDAAELTKFNSTVPASLEFPSLRDFSIDTYDLPICSELLRRPGFQHLHSLTVVRTCEDNDFIWILEPFFQTLQNHLPQLQKVILKADDHSGIPQLVSPLTTQTLTPLLSLPNISVLVIDLDVTVDLDDVKISQVADAWPNLHVLYLFDQTMGTIPKVTLGGLLPLAAACPNLEQLTLRINAFHVPNFAQTGNIIPARNLHWLNVCTSPVTNERHDLASFISLIFPSLSSLTYGCDFYSIAWDKDLALSEKRYASCWEQTCTVLKPFLLAHVKPSNHLWDHTSRTGYLY